MRYNILRISTLLAFFTIVFLSSGISYADSVKPSGGSVVSLGQNTKISWPADSSGDAVDIYLWDGHASKWHAIALGIPAREGHYDWMPEGYNPGNSYRIKVVSSVAEYLGTSYFSLAPASAASVKIESIHSQPTFQLYPNPAFNSVTIINPPGIKEVELIGVDGGTNSRYMYDGENIAHLSLAELSAGTYYVVVHSIDETTSLGRIVVVK